MSLRTIMTQVAAFTSEMTAETYRNREQGRWIILGDNGEYWVTTYRYARKLEQLGYEILDK